MKLTVTKEDLRQALLTATGVDIENTKIEVELEGYVRAKDYRLVAKLPEEPPRDTRTVVTDKNMGIVGIFPDNNKFENTDREIKSKKHRVSNLDSDFDKSPYREAVLDFATSSELSRALPSDSSVSYSCLKERYKSAIRYHKVGDDVKFAYTKGKPYLVKKHA